jgi:hypothetical protein
METVVTETIPFVAWEQAVFVGMFIVFFVGVLAWLTKYSEKWQLFMFKIDDHWRAFNKEQREENNKSLNCLESSLTDLTSVTQGLVSEVREMRADSMKFYDDFRAHDDQAKEILGKVTKTPRAPRTNGNSTENKEQ